MEFHTAYIGAGSNIGNKLLNCKNGIAALTRAKKTVLKDWSRFYKTEPVDYKDQDWFVNLVVKIETTLDHVFYNHRVGDTGVDAGDRKQTVFKFNCIIHSKI